LALQGLLVQRFYELNANPEKSLRNCPTQRKRISKWPMIPRKTCANGGVSAATADRWARIALARLPSSTLPTNGAAVRFAAARATGIARTDCHDKGYDGAI
ncbi:hypothetical protein, partial [Bifidobacterium jacchi]|uniref:hypothetical protein n=1 Tax=Bifidobacterium jacchi TaxID=2490545 RepID=UPI0019D51847